MSSKYGGMFLSGLVDMEEGVKPGSLATEASPSLYNDARRHPQSPLANRKKIARMRPANRSKKKQNLAGKLVFSIIDFSNVKKTTFTFCR